MAIIENTYVGDGSTVLYSFTFPYIETTDIKVSLDGVDTTAYSLANATTVEFDAAPAVSVAIRIYRSTSADASQATFYPGSSIRAADLNDNFTQLLHVAQESNAFALAASEYAGSISGDAAEALATADGAEATALAAEATANGIAGTASDALDAASEALSTSNGIAGTANSALVAAGDAAADAAAAVITANAAEATANGIAGDASAALSTANAAASDASTALSTANAIASTANAAMPKSGGTFTGDIKVPSINGGPISGARNRIINGDMRIDQRNAGASVTPTDGQYSVDRWKCLRSQASKYSVQQNAGAVTPPGRFDNYLGVTSLSAYSSISTDYFGISQVIEGFNSADLTFGTASALTVTLSFWARSSLTGTFGGSLRNSGNNRSYVFSYQINAANTWEFKQITITGDTTGSWAIGNGTGINLWFDLGSGSNSTAAAGSWVAAGNLRPTGSVSVVGTNAATFYITGVQLEAGTIATPFERRSHGQELALCQRYYEVGDGWVGGYAGGNGAGVFCHIPWKVTKRATPTLSYAIGTTANVSVFDIRNASTHGANWYSSGSAAGQTSWGGTWTASIEL
jgi:hypothetical protein